MLRIRTTLRHFETPPALVCQVASFAMVACWILLRPAWIDAQEALPPPPPHAKEMSAKAPVLRPTDSDESTLPMSSTPDDVEQMYGQLRALQDERVETLRQFERVGSSANKEATSRNQVSREIKKLHDQLDRNSINARSSSMRIREKLDRLKSLVDRGVFCKPSAVNPAPAPSTASGTPMAQTQPPSIQQDTTRPVIPNAVESSPGNSASPSIAQHLDDRTSEAEQQRPTDTAPVASSKAIPEPVIKALSMVDGPVDSMRFANNLYGSGEYQLSLEIYQKIERGQLTAHQRIWIEYQIANCYRRLGNRPMAERSYRIVVGEDRDGWLGKNARWWLNVGDTSVQLGQGLTNIAQTIDQLKEKQNAGN